MNIAIVRTLRDLLAEYDSALYTIRDAFDDAETEQQATALRNTLRTTADELYKFLEHYEAKK